ncbi:MAG: hypothetical protein SGBAC_012327 [Bacillariaceae sp.]
MDSQDKQCALSSFMKMFRAESLSNVKEILIVDDNARRRRSSCRRLGNALKCGKCPHRRSFRKSRRWESQLATTSSIAPASASDMNKEDQYSGILRPQRRASIERRDSIDSGTSACSSALDVSFSETLEQSTEQKLPEYDVALQMIKQKYATPTSATHAGSSIRSMSLTPPRRRPSYGDIHSKGGDQGGQRGKRSG